METHEIIILWGFALITFVALFISKLERGGHRPKGPFVRKPKPPQGGSGTAPPMKR